MGTSPEDEHPRKAFGWAARDTSGLLSPFKFSRRETGATDVRFKVLYCGVCRSDIAMTKNEFAATIYPIVPGHEVIGIVIEVGYKVRRFKIGDKVGVGFISDSDRTCCNCLHRLENYCPNLIQTYSSISYEGTVTYGGYSNDMRIPDSFASLEGVAPLLCAGITVYSPMKHFGIFEHGKHLGVVGLGGLGHLAVKFSKDVGVKVTVISSSPNKKEAMEQLGVDEFLISGDEEQLQAATDTMDGIIDTVSAPHSIMPLMGLLKTDGKLILVGAPLQPPELPVFTLIMGRKLIAGSASGGMKETQEMIHFAAKHNITADVEVVPMDYVNIALERVGKADVKYRFVIDVANTLKFELSKLIRSSYIVAN